MPRLSVYKCLRFTICLLSAAMLMHIMYMHQLPSGEGSHSLFRSQLKVLSLNKQEAEMPRLSKKSFNRFKRPLPPAINANEDQPMALTMPAAWQNQAQTKFTDRIAKLNGTALMMAMVELNKQQIVLNADIYTGPITEVVVVQVHNRVHHLFLLVDSLRRAKDIETCLLIFSHDHYSIELNSLVRSIKFARVLQIFFPYSTQVYPNIFPGADPRDCKRDAGKNSGCLNADSPDTYGHYREPKYTQTKHHWLYKNRFVFERLDILKEFGGLFVMLEEDHFVVEDFLHVLRLMRESQLSLYQSTEILTLGTYEKRPQFEKTTATVVVDKWVSSFHNMGMAFDRKVWQRIKPCLKTFCHYDDYNWDWSLNFVSNSCLKRPFTTMVVRLSPRVFHLGECGVHHKKRRCDPSLLAAGILDNLRQNRRRLYPKRLEFSSRLKIRSRRLKPNGGWGDSRDRRLCDSIFNDSVVPPGVLLAGL